MAQKQSHHLKVPNTSLTRVAFRVRTTVRVMMPRGTNRIMRHLTLLKLREKAKRMKFTRERAITTSARSVKNTLCISKMISIVTTQVVLATRTRSSCEIPGILISHLQEDQVEELLPVPELKLSNTSRRILRTRDLQGLLANNVTFAIVRYPEKIFPTMRASVEIAT